MFKNVSDIISHEESPARRCSTRQVFSVITVSDCSCSDSSARVFIRH